MACAEEGCVRYADQGAAGGLGLYQEVAEERDWPIRWMVRRWASVSAGRVAVAAWKAERVEKGWSRARG